MRVRAFLTASWMVMVFLLSGPWRVSGEMEEEGVYPMIINTDGDKAVLILPDQGCHVLDDMAYIKRIIALRQPQAHIYRSDNATVNSVVELCNAFQEDRINGTQFVIGLREKSVLIFPGTHYCGAGHNAEHYDDLGYYRETDKCCRDHDYCTNFVQGRTCHHKIPNLCNASPFTRSDCECDLKFRECLQNTNETASIHIGVLFFTIFGLKCFREDFPIISCQEYGGFLHLHCQRYLLDSTKERVYQFFDSPRYKVRRKEAVLQDENSSTTTTENFAEGSTTSIFYDSTNPEEPEQGIPLEQEGLNEIDIS